MVVITRLELDHYSVEQITSFVVNGVVTIGEAIDGAKAIREMSDVNRLMWERSARAMFKAAHKAG